MSNGIGKRIPGIILTLAILVLEGIFAALLIKTQLLPTLHIVMICVILVALAGGLLYLTWDLRRKWRLVVTVVVAVLIMVGIGITSTYVKRGVETLDEITQVTVEVADVGVYVRLDDAAESINDTAGYVFGILSQQDRENTDKALEQLSDTLGQSLSLKEYDGLAELVDSLFTTGETQAIVLNSAFVELLADMEGYETAEAQLREVHVQQVETIIEHTVDKTTAEDGAEADASPTPAEERTTFSLYISGIDSRSGLIAKSRSDVNIIATVNTETRQVLLVSTPRDFYVPLPISNGAEDKLTHAGIYGVDVSIGTLEMLYDTEIDYYFRVNFSGFEGIIDALGGVTVDSPVSFTRDGYTIYKGENNLNGAEALIFARERKKVSGGDRQRGKDQMILIEAVIDKVTSPALLANYSAILEQVSGNFETSVPYEMVAELVREQLADDREWNVVAYSVDGTGASRKPYSLSTNAYVMLPDYNTVNHAIELMQQVKNGEILTEEE